jgi:cell division transport system permease protein
MPSATPRYRPRLPPSALPRSPRAQRRIRTPIRNYLLNHYQEAFASLGRLVRAPVSSFLTIAVIGIAVTLPAGLHVLAQNLQQLDLGWSKVPTISLFLIPHQEPKVSSQLAQHLQTWPQISAVDYISPQAALAEFEQQFGLQDLQVTLGENPLPAVLVAQIAPNANDPKTAQHLVTQLQNLPEVDIAQLDLKWLQRLNAFTALIKRGVLILTSLLAIGVLLITSNTVRLAVLNRQEEIRIIKLVGGTDAFIRRPFLYTGAWYGFGGGLFAWLILSLILGLLADPSDRLAYLYHSRFTLTGLSLAHGVGLCTITTLLSVGGAYFAVAGHLRAIEPR